MLSERIGPRTEKNAGLVADLPPGTTLSGGLAALIVIVAALIAWPFSGTTLGDDFSYVKTAADLARTGQLHYNGWASMTLGWQAVWGAAFIRAFGFSFNVLRLSMILLAATSIFLFQRVLARFGLSRTNAFFGALTLGLTPLFLPLSASFMSDIPGLLAVILCIAMCQRAVLAKTGASTAGWLVGAAAVNVMGGSVRQICWLGALIMVPATAWLVRKRRGVVASVAVAWVLSLAAVYASVRWFAQQPYAVPEHLYLGHIRASGLQHLAAQLIKAALCTALLTAPIGVGWLGSKTREQRRRLVAAAAMCLVAAAVLWIVAHRGHLDEWTLPWLVPVLQSQGMVEAHGPMSNPITLHLGTRTLFSLFVVATGTASLAGVLSFLFSGRPPRTAIYMLQDSGRFWIIAPFTLSALALMMPRGIISFIQDRYLLLLLPGYVLALLSAYENLVGPRLPMSSFVVLIVFCCYGVAGLHDEQAGARADLKAVAELEASGVPRTQIAEGFGPDEWVEVNRHGHVNAPVPHSPDPYIDPVSKWALPDACMPFDYTLIPDIQPSYILTQIPNSCYLPSGLPPVTYIAWLPPFHRATYILRPAGR